MKSQKSNAIGVQCETGASNSTRLDTNFKLSQQDANYLMTLNKKLQVLRDRVVGVAKGYHTGAIIHGRGGTGKSYTTVQELEQLGVPYVMSNSHLTPRGLFDLFANSPESIHVIEDAEGIIRNQTSLSVLRSALWGNQKDRMGRNERLITWKTYHGATNVFFGGGVILILNRGLSDLPEAKALATRVPDIEIVVSDREIAAMMRSVASGGYKHGDLILAADECLEIANYIISESATLNRALDMRLLVNAFRDRIQEEDCDAGCTWQDLVYSTLCGRPSIVNKIEPFGLREQKKQYELEIVRELLPLAPQQRLVSWQEKTGKSQATLYRRLAELGGIDAEGIEL